MFIARHVLADHLEGFPFFPTANADWHYARHASNVADPKTEQAALKSAQCREWGRAMEKGLAAMDALGVFDS